MATITKRHGKRGIRYRAEVRRGGRAVSKTFTSKREADAWARKLEGDEERLEAEGSAEGRRRTLEDAIKRFMRERSLRDHSVGTRMGWWADRHGKKRLNQITPALIADALQEYADTGVKPSSVNRLHAAISTVLQTAYRQWHWTASNPARKVERRPESKGRDRWLDENERKELLDAINDLIQSDDKKKRVPAWFRVWVLVLMTTGMRRGEATRLMWGDVDLEQGVVRVRHTKTDKPRSVPLMKPVVEALSELRGPAHPLPTLPVFPMSSEYEPDRHWAKAKERAGIENCRMHDLRHTAASILAQSNASDLTIAALLGHSTLAMVKRYSHHRTDAVREQLDKAWEGKL